jgi:hypothetical protein
MTASARLSTVCGYGRRHQYWRAELDRSVASAGDSPNEHGKSELALIEGASADRENAAVAADA